MGNGCAGGGKDDKSRSNGSTIDSQQSQSVDPFKIGLSEIEDHLQDHYYFYNDDELFEQGIMNSVQAEFGTAVTVFDSWKQLGTIADDKKRNHLYVCTSDPTVVRREVPSKFTFRSITYVTNNKVSEDDKAKLKDRYGWRYGGVLPVDLEQVKQHMKSRDDNKRSLLFCHKDQALITRACLTQYSFFYQNKEYPISHFIDYLRTMDTDIARQLVNRLQTLGKDEHKRAAKIIVEEVLAEPQLFQRCQGLLRDGNPMIIPHVAWPYEVLCRHISSTYNVQKRRMLQESHKPIDHFFVVVELNPQEVRVLRDRAQGQNFMFTTMPVGYKQRDDIPRQRGPNSYIFQVHVPSRSLKYKPDTDLGFVLQGNRVIVNLLNFYHIDTVHSGQNEVSVTYGNITEQRRVRDNRTEKRFEIYSRPGDITMMRQYDYFTLMKGHCKNQLDLMFTLQMYNCYYKQVVERVSQSTRSGLTESSENFPISLSQTNTFFVPSYDSSEKMGDIERERGNFQEAEAHYREVLPKEKGTFNILSMYHSLRMSEQFLSHYNRFRDNMTSQKRKQLQKNHPFLYKAYVMYSAEALLAKGTHDKADSKIKQLIDADYQEKFVEEFQKAYLNENYQVMDMLPLNCKITKTRSSIAKAKGYLNDAEQQGDNYASTWSLFDGIHIHWLV